MEQEDFIKEWLEGKISSNDLDKKIRQNFPEKDADRLKKIIARSSELRVPEKRTKEEAWNLLSENIQDQKTPERVIKLDPWISLSIAASITILVVSYFIFFKPETVIAPAGAHVAYFLPDGSEVVLNADSRITFKPFKPGRARKVKLKGEAFFEVKAGTRFEVDCKHGTVTVLGTSFNINDRNEILEVACFSGSVQVTTTKGERIILKAGEFTQTKDEKLISPTPFDEERTATWRQGDFHFEGVPFEVVLEELSRQFDIEILYKPKSERTYTGYFNNKDLDEALQLVFEPMKLRYKKDGNKIIVE